MECVPECRRDVFVTADASDQSRSRETKQLIKSYGEKNDKEPVLDDINKRKWHWLGHTLRLGQTVDTANPQSSSSPK